MLKYPKPKNQRIPFEFVGNNYSMWKLSTEIRSCPAARDHCPVCHAELKADFTLIPVSKDKKAKIEGRYCSQCKCLYTTEAYFVELIMHDNKFSKEFTLDGESLWNISFVKEQQKKAKKRKQQQQELLEKQRIWIQEKKKILDTVPLAEVLVCVQFQNEEKEDFIITRSKEDSDNTTRSYYYGSETGREILSAAFANERENVGHLRGKSFRVIGDPVYNNSLVPMNNILVSELNIKTGGGYPTEIRNNRYEIVDMLVYSPLSNRYELMRATYSKDDAYCFVDIGIYRQFVKKYGRPPMMPNFERKCGSLYRGDLNDESILKGYGYAVNQNDNLSVQYRQDLLAEIIDLEIMTAPRIVRFLEWLISFHPHHPNAQWAWKEDIKFVENYKANPQRFLIAK